MLMPIYRDDTRPRDPHDEHVHLFVNVLVDAASDREFHQVDVKVGVLFQGPDHPRTLSCEVFVEIYYVCSAHPNEILAYVLAENDGVSYAPTL